MLLPTLSFAGEEKGSATASGETKYLTKGAHCRDGNGQRRELGEVICITASCLTWMAKCELVLNNAIWRKTQEGCPTAGLYERFLRVKPEISLRPTPYNPAEFLTENRANG
ncbi:MAG: hypothetical protein ACU0CA_03220 [Paracoccaceae bacterium]